MKIRDAKDSDRASVDAVYRDAFPPEEARLVAPLAADLLAEHSDPATRSFVMDDEGRVIGHVCFSPVFPENWNGDPVYILAPLAVLSERQGQGIGRALVEHGLSLLRTRDVVAVLVYGDPNYYARFGFNSAVAGDFVPPFPLEQPHGWQGMVLLGAKPWDGPSKIRCVPSLQKQIYW